MKISRAPFRKEVKARQEDALDMLVDLLDWLDGLEPQPTTIGNATTIIADPYTSTYPPMDQAVSKGAEHPAVSSSTCLHLTRRSNLILIGSRT